MRTPAIIRSISLAFLLGAFLLVVAFPTGAVLAAEEEDPPYMFLDVINDSQFDFVLYLYGQVSYTITVPPKTQETFVLDRDWYAFTMDSCNLTEVGTFDFHTHKTIHVPVCGATAGLVGQANNHIDTSDYIRPAMIKIRNKTHEQIEIYIRTLDEDHFMTFEPLETQWLLIDDSRDTFVFSYVACGVLQSGYTRLYVHVPFDLTCNK